MPEPAQHFVAPPGWEWWILGYFFLGGISGGSYAIGTLLRLLGTDPDRRAARIAFIVSFLALLPCPILLILDLGQPLRFLNMLFDMSEGGLAFKPESPMSVGAWALLVYGLFSFGSFLGAIAESGWRVADPVARVLRGAVGAVWNVMGTVFGLFVAGYTGVLLSVTNRPIWADSPWLGALFLVSGASTGAATLYLVGRGRGAAERTLGWLTSFDTRALVFELLVLIAFVASLGEVARVWLSVWGALLLVGVVGFGILVPLGLHLRPATFGRLAAQPAVNSAKLVLLGGFLLRVVTIMASEGIALRTATGALP